MDTEESVSCFNVLGGLLYLSPLDESLKPVFNIFSDPDWISNWPCGAYDDLVKIDELIQQEPHDPSDLEEPHKELFNRVEHLKAPPWGSIYLDPERRVFGPSTLKLRSFMEEQGIALNLAKEEPEDHIGLLLLTAAWLGVAKREKALSILLSEYILPWTPVYFDLLKAASPHSFYKGIADLALITLEAVSKTRELIISPVNLYQ